MDISYPFNRTQHIRSGVRVRTIILPYWIDRVLKRNKLDYIDILNYDRLRKVLSVEDFALFLAANRSIGQESFDSIFGNSFIEFDFYCQKSNPEKSNELNNIIVPLSESETTRSALYERLLKPDFDYQDDLSSGQLYRFQTLNDQSLLVFVERGLLNAFENRDFAKAFISDYLKALYSLLPISDVSNSYTAFERYLDLL